MEPEEIKKIKSSLPRLIEFTSCTGKFLSYLCADNILSSTDVDDITSHRMESNKVYKLYNILLTRQNSYKALLKALTATRQTGALYVLENEDSAIHQILSNNENRIFKFKDEQEFTSKIKRKLEGESSGTGKRSLQSYDGNPIMFSVRDPVALFTGRLSELTEIHNLLHNTNSVDKPYNVVIISGVSGIGKSEVARKYIQQYSQDYNSNIIWIEAETKEAITNSFRNLAKDKLNISTTDANGTEKDTKSIIDDVVSFFQTTKLLLVYDNVESTSGQNFAQYLPSPGITNESQVFILLISQSHEKTEGAGVVILKELCDEDCTQFVKKGLGIKLIDLSQNNEISQLTKRLQHFPLAIQQAISYIKDQQELDTDYGIAKYLQDFEQNTKSMLDSSVRSGLLHDYVKTTYSAWSMTMSKIKDNSKFGTIASSVLNMLAYVSSDNIHLHETILKFTDDSTTESQIRDAAIFLLKYSIIRKNDGEGNLSQNTFSIHRLLQEVNRLQLKDRDEEPLILDQLLTILEKILDSENNLDHSLTVWKYVSPYTELVIKHIKFPKQVVQKLVDTARFEEAYTFGGLTICDITKAMKSDCATDVLELQLLISDALMFQGKYDEGIEIVQEVIDKQESAQSDINFLFKSKSALAWLLFEKGRHNEAQIIFQDLFEMQKAHLGMQHIDTVRTLCNMGSPYLSQGKFNKALELYRQALQLKKAIDGDKCDGDNLSALFMHNIGFCLGEMGEFEAAIQTIKEVIRIQNQILTKGHPNNILSNAVLASNLNSLGRRDEAFEVVEKILELRANILETDQPEEFSVNIIGTILRDRGELEKALKIHRKCYHHLVATLGANHEMTLLTKRNIALVLSRQGDDDVALNILKHVWEFLVPNLGERHLLVAKLEVEIAALLEKQKQYKDAYCVLENTREKFLDFGEGNYYYRETVENMLCLKDMVEQQ